MNNSKRTLIWDLPTRVFHWMLAGGFFIAAFFAMVLGEHNRLFPYHAIVGLTVSLMIVMRVLWGFAGTRYARFSSFAYGPNAAIDYLRGVLRGSLAHHIGHNPAGAWAIFAMLALVFALGLTGLFLGQGNEGIEELHEFFAYSMATVVVLHILGVLLHIIRHRENIVASMIHGRKDVDAQAGIASSHPVAALIFCVVCVGWGLGLIANYDAAKQTTRLPIIGLSVQIGEVEDKHGPNGKRRHDNDD